MLPLLAQEASASALASLCKAMAPKTGGSAMEKLNLAQSKTDQSDFISLAARTR